MTVTTGQGEPERGQVQFGRRQLGFTVSRSPRRETVSLVVGADGVLVSAPPDVPLEALSAIVLSRGAWVVRKLSRLEEITGSVDPPRRFESGESFRYLGRQYRLKRYPSHDSGAARVRLSGRFLEVWAADTRAARVGVECWYRTRAAERLPERVRLYSRRLGLGPPPVLVRDQRRRWGSCSARGELRFNWRVIMAPMGLVDYVVVHELCHLAVPNHSPAFWDLVGQLLPDFEHRRERLAHSGPSLRL